MSEEISISHFLVELGSMDYGLDIDGIIGYDFMKEVNCRIGNYHFLPNGTAVEIQMKYIV